MSAPRTLRWRPITPTGQGQTDAKVAFLAGGTTLIDLMKLDVLRPERVVDITPLKARHSEIEATGGPASRRLRLYVGGRGSSGRQAPTIRRWPSR